MMVCFEDGNVEKHLDEDECKRFMFSNTCRLCVRKDETLCNLFVACDSDGNNLLLPEKIFTLLDIMIKVNDGLTDQICEECVTFICSLYDFREKCRANDSILRSIFCDTKKVNKQSENTFVLENQPLDGREQIIIGVVTDYPSCEVEGLNHTSDKLQEESQNSHAQFQHTLSDSSILIETHSNEPTVRLVEQLENEWADEDELNHPVGSESQEDLPWRISPEVLPKDEPEEDSDYDDNWSMSSYNSGGKENDELPAVDSYVVEADGSNKRKPNAATRKNLCGGRISQEASGKWVCSICDAKSCKLKVLQKHVIRHYAFYEHLCPECVTPFDSVEALARHEAKHAESSLPTGFSCDKCYKTFRKEHLLAKHKNSDHSCDVTLKASPKKFIETCGKCVRVFYCSWEMENHDESCDEGVIKSDEEEERANEELKLKQTDAFLGRKNKRKDCHKCRLTFDTLPQLMYHYRETHGDDEPLKCDIDGCDAVFQTAELFYRHKYKHHDRLYECHICQKSFKQRAYLSIHISRHNLEKTVTCRICDKKFYNVHTLKQHQKIHERIHKCEKCDRKFATTFNLDRHVMATHNSDKMHFCDKCGRTFACPKSFKAHCKKPCPSFSKEIMFCDLCNKRFKGYYEYKKHQEKHITERNAICESCGKAFKTMRAVQEHKSRFCKKLECTTCGIYFFSTGKFNIHQRQHVKDKIFKCKVCFATFSHASSLVKHRRQKHPEKVRKREKQPLLSEESESECQNRN